MAVEERPAQPDEGGDAALVQRTLAGDQAAFEALVRRYERLVFSVVRSLLGRSVEVEDVAQEAFLNAFRGLGGFRQEGRLAPWLARIATRASLDRLRRPHGRVEGGWTDLAEAERLEGERLAAGGAAGDQVAARDLAEHALGRLRPLDRALVLLVDGHGFTPAEAGRMIGSTALAARVRLHRARRRLRREAEGLLQMGAVDRRRVQDE